MRNTPLLTAGLLVAGLATTTNAAEIWSLDFETPGGYTTSVAEFSDGSNDFFTRTDGSDVSGSYEVANLQGSFFFGAQDIDGEGAEPPLELNVTGIDIAGLTDLGFAGLFAEDDDGSNEDWDTSDFVHVQYQIDGGGFQDMLNFESIPDGDAFNAVPAQDTDFDGDGNVGSELTDTFSEFTADIAGTGSTLDLKVVFDLDSGDEDIALDNLSVTGVPEPGSLAMGLIGFSALALRRRRA